jgi:DNA-binding response OmpR family regulator
MVPERGHANLALVIEEDPPTRRHARSLLEGEGYEVVHAATGLAGLELIQRLPGIFSLVLTELDLRGLPGAVILETLRLFRPDLPVLCMSGRRAVASALGCLGKPLVAEELAAQLRNIRSGAAVWDIPAIHLDDEAVSRARAKYAMGGDLAEAALELSRGLSSDGRAEP